jgi:hypothetical protein
VAVVLTLVQTKQIIYLHKRNSIKTQYKQFKTQSIQVHALPKHPHITKQVKTTTVKDTHHVGKGCLGESIVEGEAISCFPCHADRCHGMVSSTQRHVSYGSMEGDC